VYVELKRYFRTILCYIIEKEYNTQSKAMKFQDKTARFQLVLTPHEKSQINDISKRTGLKMSHVILKAINEYERLIAA